MLVIQINRVLSFRGGYFSKIPRTFARLKKGLCVFLIWSCLFYSLTIEVEDFCDSAISSWYYKSCVLNSRCKYFVRGDYVLRVPLNYGSSSRKSILNEVYLSVDPSFRVYERKLRVVRTAVHSLRQFVHSRESGVLRKRCFLRQTTLCINKTVKFEEN